MNVYVYCRVGRTEQLNDRTSHSKVLAKSKEQQVIKEIDKMLENE